MKKHSDRFYFFLALYCIIRRPIFRLVDLGKALEALAKEEKK